MNDPTPSRQWLALADVCAILDETPGRVHRLLEENRLAGRRRDGVLMLPADFLRDGAPLPELRGTLILLGDAGFDTDEAIDWLLMPNDLLEAAPIDALRAGRKAEVRRVAQALA